MDTKGIDGCSGPLAQRKWPAVGEGVGNDRRSLWGPDICKVLYNPPNYSLGAK